MVSTKISRKTFFRWILSLSLIPLLFLLDELVVKSRKYGNAAGSMEVPSDLAIGVSIFDNIIVVRTENNITFFSAKCTHLGCLINKADNKQITCPCHGSVFNLEGKSIKGPASTSLKKLEYTVDSENGNYIVQLS